MDMHGPPTLPPELRPFRNVVENFISARIRQFASVYATRVSPHLTREQQEHHVQESLKSLPPLNGLSHVQQMLRLVLRHDCQSTGCGEPGCLLCQFNPSRLCKRNLKQKYLIDDHLRAKCGAPLRVELVDEAGQCVQEGLAMGHQLEVHMLNGEKYREVCPDNTLLSHKQLEMCVIKHQTKALLKRENVPEDGSVQVFLPLESGQAALSDLTVTTSSEALLSGKAPTFRLLVWAVDGAGQPVENVTYVVSENFVVATKRVKHAIKSDIPSIDDHVSKLVHIGKATVDKLQDLRAAAREEGFEVNLPDELNKIERVGKFRDLVARSEVDSDLKSKVRHLLKLSPEKWEEVTSHALQAVVPDFRPRVWWYKGLAHGAGLLFQCKNGAVVMDHPLAMVRLAHNGEEEEIIELAKLDSALQSMVPKLKNQAVQHWFAPGHPHWAIHWKESASGVGVDGLGGAGLPPQGANAPPNGYMEHGGIVLHQTPAGIVTIQASPMNTTPDGGMVYDNGHPPQEGTVRVPTPPLSNPLGLTLPPTGLPHNHGGFTVSYPLQNHHGASAPMMQPSSTGALSPGSAAAAAAAAAAAGTAAASQPQPRKSASVFAHAPVQHLQQHAAFPHWHGPQSSPGAPQNAPPPPTDSTQQPSLQLPNVSSLDMVRFLNGSLHTSLLSLPSSGAIAEAGKSAEWALQSPNPPNGNHGLGIGPLQLPEQTSLGLSLGLSGMLPPGSSLSALPFSSEASLQASLFQPQITSLRTGLGLQSVELTPADSGVQ